MTSRHLIPLLLAVAACGTSTEAPVLVHIPAGASLSSATDSLVAHGVVTSPFLFRLYARVLGKSDELRAGVYELRPGSSIAAVVRTLTSGKAALRRLVLPEGLMLGEVAAAVEQQLGIPEADFQAAARMPALVDRVDPGASSTEGYLYPSTYLVRFGVTAPEIVAQMLNEFEAHWRPEWNARLDSLGMTRHDLVTLASIIEGEVRYAPDGPFVSSVYHNRLRRHMRLQADPTVIYTLGKRRRLYEKDYLRRSPYNTYLIDGLPPGPIGQPAEASLYAALYPATTDFLFFVAQGDGKHVFSRTLREHLAAIQAARAALPVPRLPRPG